MPIEDRAGGPVAFPPTLWTAVLQAAHGNEVAAQQALWELCERYRPAFLLFFKIKLPHHQNAEDLASAFTEYLLKKNPFRHFEQREGCPFRA